MASSINGETLKGGFSRDELFHLTMEKKWDKVQEVYEMCPPARKEKLTNSEDTALHVVISSYHSKCDSLPYEVHISKMVKCIPDKDFLEVLSMENEKGNTPLHLAAEVGWVTISELIASRNIGLLNKGETASRNGDTPSNGNKQGETASTNHNLLNIRNKKGETPLFLAADHGNLDAFLLLHHIYNPNRGKGTNQRGQGQKPDVSPCRRDSDGSTILHSAISGEYFNLAYQIICLYPKLVNYYNVDGELPLHILAKKPNVFRSSSHFRLYDSLIYGCTFVDKLKEQDGTCKNNCCKTRTYPENYKTCVDMFEFLVPIFRSIQDFPGKFTKLVMTVSHKLKDSPNDVENQQQGVEIENEEKETEAAFPPIYETGILLLKFASKVVLTIIGFGIWRIKKLQRKKEIHSHALQILNKMLESNKTYNYKYPDNGQKPRQNLEFQFSGRVAPPSFPPQTSDQQVFGQSTQTPTTDQNQPQNQNGKQKDEKALTGTVENEFRPLARKETPLLVAAQMGIHEVVHEILERFPVAIQDVGSSGKNVLMLAAENRQTAVFDYLIEMKLPKSVFHQLDNEGNSILHLAARKVEELEPWRIPGAALQMQWEIKWYKHVKRNISSVGFRHINAKGETPRKIFKHTHQEMIKEGSDWLIKTSESCSVVAALVAGVAFGTSATVPGGVDDQSGHPVLADYTAFDVFSITSLVALCLAITALVFFLSIITSRCQERDFKIILPRKLLMGLTCLFASIIAMLVSFCAGHTFILRDRLKYAAVPIYAVACVPVALFAIAQLPLYFDILRATILSVPLRSYKVFRH